MSNRTLRLVIRGERTQSGVAFAHTSSCPDASRMGPALGVLVPLFFGCQSLARRNVGHGGTSPAAQDTGIVTLLFFGEISGRVVPSVRAWESRSTRRDGSAGSVSYLKGRTFRARVADNAAVCVYMFVPVRSILWNHSFFKQL